VPWKTVNLSCVALADFKHKAWASWLHHFLSSCDCAVGDVNSYEIGRKLTGNQEFRKNKELHGSSKRIRPDLSTRLPVSCEAHALHCCACVEDHGFHETTKTINTSQPQRKVCQFFSTIQVCANGYVLQKLHLQRNQHLPAGESIC